MIGEHYAIPFHRPPLYLIQLAAAIVLVLVANLFGWFIALFVDRRTGMLPVWLRWFQTPDATCYDVQWVELRYLMAQAEAQKP